MYIAKVPKICQGAPIQKYEITKVPEIFMFLSNVTETAKHQTNTLAF